jgi:hypothetical protein
MPGVVVLLGPPRQQREKEQATDVTKPFAEAHDRAALSGIF